MTAIDESITLNQLQAKFNAIILSVGKIETMDQRSFQLTMGKRGFQVDRQTFKRKYRESLLPGGCITAKGMAIQAVADGKLVAAAVH